MRTIPPRKYLCALILAAMPILCFGKKATETVKVLLSQGSTTANCYTAVLPKKRPFHSYLVLIPGFGETPEGVLKATDLPRKAARAGIAVFIPQLQNGAETYSFAAESQKCLQNMIRDIKERFGLAKASYCVGGFSMGGSAAIRHAELSAENPPVCVFAIDSPLDYERFRYSTERDVKVYHKGMADGDSIYIKLLADIAPIVGDSPYLLSDTTHRAILPLRNIPTRYYIEPAEQWWLDNRQTDVLGLNILDGSAFVNDLRLIGNKDAELIVTSGKGRRNNGKTYHPHSWTIADTKELIAWILRCHAAQSTPQEH